MAYEKRKLMRDKDVFALGTKEPHLAPQEPGREKHNIALK